MTKSLPLTLLLFSCPSATALAQKRPPEFSHGFEVKVRPAKEATFDVHLFHIEAFKDVETGCALYVCQTGDLAAIPRLTFDARKTKPTDFRWHTAMEVPVRAAGVKDFKHSKRWSVETYHDGNTAATLYIADSGALAALPDTKPRFDDKMAAPDWLAGPELRVRDLDFEAKPHRIGTELYRDRNLTSLLYMTEKGKLAVAAEQATKRNEATVEWLYALALKARRHDERDFSPRTGTWGIEVFRDGDNLVYVCGSGSIAVTANRKGLRKPPARANAPELRHGLNLKARRAGEKEFTKETRVLGIECFRDPEADTLVYITEAGGLAVVPAPAR